MENFSKREKLKVESTEACWNNFLPNVRSRSRMQVSNICKESNKFKVNSLQYIVMGSPYIIHISLFLLFYFIFFFGGEISLHVLMHSMQ